MRSQSLKCTKYRMSGYIPTPMSARYPRSAQRIVEQIGKPNSEYHVERSARVTEELHSLSKVQKYNYRTNVLVLD